MNRISSPRRRVINDHEAYLWTVQLDGVEHHFAWWVTDGTLRWSYPLDERRWSQFVRLGPRYSPCRSVFDAHAAIERWIEVQQEQRQAS